MDHDWCNWLGEFYKIDIDVLSAYTLCFDLIDTLHQLCMARVSEPQEFHAENAYRKWSEGLALCPTVAGGLVSIYGAILEEC